MNKAAPSPVFALGHSTLPIGKFVLMLRAHSMTTLVDIRTIPKSRHNPQFDGEALRASLAEQEIGYIQMKGLGGLRRPLKDSVTNAGWLNASFRGFADYMQTEQFEAALEELIALARRTARDEGHRLAMMCAEGNPFRCHRSLIADALVARGIPVIQISGEGKGRLHTITRFAEVAGYRVIYPPIPREDIGEIDKERRL